MRYFLLVFSLLFSLLPPLRAGNPGAPRHNTDYIDPFHGVDNKGNTLPGAALPFSMVKLSPDVLLPSRWTNSNSGYSTGFPCAGFSHTHVSGTGGGAKYGNFRVMPIVGSANVRDFSCGIIYDRASAGYYYGELANGVKVELTATHSVGFHRYVFPAAEEVNIYMDASSLLDKGSTPQHLLASGINIISDTEMTGYCTSEGGWNVGKPFTVYFYAKADRPAVSWGTFRGDRHSCANTAEVSVNSNDHLPKSAYFTYSAAEGCEVNLKVAISYISIEKARENYTREAESVTFEQARQAARAAWSVYTERLRVEAPEEAKSLIYNGIYRTMLMPVNRTGEKRGWENETIYYDDFYAIWDTFRTCFPLMSLIAPERMAEMITALVNIGQREGYMPDARSGDSNGLTQGGSNCDVVIAEAFVKNIKGVDYGAAYELMKKNAEVEPAHPRMEGRGGIEEFKSMGYISEDHERSGTRQTEYAYCDYALYQVASGLGKHSEAERYLERSGYWRNLWNADAEDNGFRGFIWPRGKDGAWRPDYDPTELAIWTKVFYESSSWEYSFYVPHDVGALIDYCGGRKEFIRRLDYYFDRGAQRERGFYNVGNEPSFLTPCLYIWAGRYYKTAERVSEIMERSFGAGRSGLPGNDDSGAMSSWCAFHLLGLFPNAGQDYYLLTSPRIEQAELDVEGGTFRIAVKNGGGKNIYIRSARLNGKNYDKAWIRHSDIVAGGVLELTMGSSPSRFGTRDLPPSGR